MRDVAALGPNARVRTSMGLIATIASVPLFGGVPSVKGQWTVPNMRVFVGGAPTIGASSVGVALSQALVPASPMLVITPDPRTSAM